MTTVQSRKASTDSRLKAILVDLLGLDPARVAAFDHATGLFGDLPEFDSMAVATLLTAIEDHFGFVIDDDDLEPEMLETYGALLAFVEQKLNG